MFMLAVVLAGFSMAIEYSLIRKFRWLLKLMENPKVGPLVSLGFSFVLSVILGSAFGAAGLIVMVAGITSTVLMQPVYSMIRKGSWDQYCKKIDTNVASVKQMYRSAKGFGHDLMAIARVVGAILAIPILILVKAIWLIARICEFLSDPKEGIKKLR